MSNVKLYYFYPFEMETVFARRDVRSCMYMQLLRCATIPNRLMANAGIKKIRAA